MDNDKSDDQVSMSVTDKILRYGIAAFFVAQVFFVAGPMGWRAYPVLLGVLIATSALCGWDPVYQWLNRRAHRRQNVFRFNKPSTDRRRRSTDTSRLPPHKVA